MVIKASDVAPDSMSTHRAGTFEVRRVASSLAEEIYITAAPSSFGRHQTFEMYSHIAHLLNDCNAHIVQERLFASSDALALALSARTNGYGSLIDAVPPTLLVTRSDDSPIVGIQVHAIAGISRPRIIRGAGRALGRIFDCNGYKYVTASGLRAPQLNAPADQAHRAFELTEAILLQADASMSDLARTWIWMDDILTWYPQLNDVRSAFFADRNLLGPGRMPASTGIGVSPAGARVAIDLFAAFGRPDAVTRFHAIGNQRSANEYGSAFARAARVQTPGGMTVFCSGTAAIDSAGKTCFVNDAAAQVIMTIDNVRAVLSDTGCSSNHIVTALAYCATPAARAAFEQSNRNLHWPCLLMSADVCRSDLLFEVELTASRPQ